MKTIWILNHYAVTPIQGGGTRHFSFAKSLVEKGYTVYVFASSFLHDNYINVLEKDVKTREIEIEGIHWVWINTKEYKHNGKDRLLGMIDYYRFMMRNYGNYKKPDVIVGSAVHLLACVAGYKISKKTRAICVSEIRDLWPETLVDFGKIKRNSLVAKILYSLEKYVYRHSDRIVVTAAGMADYIVKTGISENKISYINNGVDVKAFDRLKKDEGLHLEAQKILDENRDQFKCVYTGAIGEANDLSNLVKAAQIICQKGYQEIRIIIVGEGPQKQMITELSEELKCDNVKIYDFISKNEIPKLLTEANVNIFNLKRMDVLKYGLSANKLFDYMCSGKPIVFACNSPDDYVEKSGGGISVEPENPEAMADAIIKIYKMSEEERKNLGKNAREYVEKYFDIPVLVERLEQVITLN